MNLNEKMNMNDFQIIDISTETTNESMVDIETFWGKFWKKMLIKYLTKKVTNFMQFI